MNTSMKWLISGIVLLSASIVQAAPRPSADSCAISVGITARTGAKRDTANALEVWNLAEKGLVVCQGDEPGPCRPEFHLELRYRADMITRYVAIYRGKKVIYFRDFTGHESSQKIMKTLPMCSRLQALAAGGGEAPRRTQ